MLSYLHTADVSSTNKHLVIYQGSIRHSQKQPWPLPLLSALAGCPYPRTRTAKFNKSNQQRSWQWVAFQPNMSYIPPGKDRWLATPTFWSNWYFMAPYKSPPFRSGVIYFHHRVIHYVLGFFNEVNSFFLPWMFISMWGNTQGWCSYSKYADDDMIANQTGISHRIHVWFIYLTCTDIQSAKM